MSDSAIHFFDFTLPQKYVGEEFEEFFDFITEHCEHYCFQLEEGGETGYLHYQGRIKTKKRVRLSTLINHWHNNNYDGHLSRTSSNGKGCMSYVMKIDTRVEGPWSDDPERIYTDNGGKYVTYIPRQIREIEKLYPWQETVIKKSVEWEPRQIDIIVDLKGCTGKTFLKGYMRVHGLARPVPYFNDIKDIMRCIMCVPTSSCYIFDLPRALTKEHLNQFYAGIEEIKNGHAYDDRYKFREKDFDSPRVWIFTNRIPELHLMSVDRWRFWRIKKRDHSLVEYRLREVQFDLEVQQRDIAKREQQRSQCNKRELTMSTAYESVHFEDGPEDQSTSSEEEE